VSKLYVIVETESPDYQRVGSAKYVVAGPLPRGHWTRRQAVLGADEARWAPYSMAERLLPVRDCFIQAEEFADGTHEILYNPL